jgi:SusD family.
MKIKYTYLLLMAAGLLLSGNACKNSFLDEEPLDFLGSGNALVTRSDFDVSVNNLYDLVRFEFYTNGQDFPMDYIYGTDLVFDGEPSQRRWTSYGTVMVAQGGPGIPQKHWNSLFKIVSESNIVLGRLADSQLSDADKELIEAEGKFFRAFAYRTLAYLYGGVPLVLDEISSPRFDFVRATKAEVLNQIIQDLEFSVAHLPLPAAVKKGQIHKFAAAHLLAEVYLAAKQFDKAAAMASLVIDDPSTDLMQQRFGTRATETPGDVYWDLFREGNQNYATNTEALWVIQFETDVPGGSSVISDFVGSPVYERHCAPNFSLFQTNWEKPFLWPVGDYTGGRGIGWAITTKYFSNTIWESDFKNDIRNANHNFVREFVANNTASKLFGQVISTEHPPAGITVPSRQFYAYQSKVTTPYHHPENLYLDKSKYLLKNTAGGTYTDQYMFRLAETYLIRAEAYLGENDLVHAAADINTVRRRSKASEITTGQVSLDYILDERMRELGVEEKRRLTLMRLGKLYDRVKRFNPYYSDIQPAHNLFPIPQAEIERNREAVLEQNDGY